MMELYIAGGCSEHGRNSFLVTGKKLCFLVDAGLMKEKPDHPFPMLYDEQIRKIDYLFLTHCHADHAGALLWLYERGFRGKVIASRATLDFIPGKIRGANALEDYAKPRREFRVDEDLYVTWGRSGHCIGSVWFLFRVGEKKILFTGDYEERSYAYKCDHIRDLTADIAVIDCAYGFEKEGADAHRRAIENYLDEQREKKLPLLFPVPSHGRGYDVLRLLAERGIRAVMSNSICLDYHDMQDKRLWLKRGFLDSVSKLESIDISGLEKMLASFEDTYPKEYIADAVLVRDSQLSREVNRHTADCIREAGGRTVLTGKQDPASYARKLLDEGSADFLRLSVHQNADELLRLMKRNEFRAVVPYHCREELTFKKKRVIVLHPGDRVKF